MTKEMEVLLEVVDTIAQRDGSDPLQVLLEIVYKAKTRLDNALTHSIEAFKKAGSPSLEGLLEVQPMIDSKVPYTFEKKRPPPATTMKSPAP
jgi:hypothetical protein